MGWLPALGILKPATKQPLPRTSLMIGAHLIWGAVTGLLEAEPCPRSPDRARRNGYGASTSRRATSRQHCASLRAKPWGFSADRKAMPLARQFDHSGSAAPIVSEYARDPDMAELIIFFIAELQSRIGVMSQAVESGDLKCLKTMAHQIKGAAGGYGFPAITNCAAELEAVLNDDGVESPGLRQKTDALIAVCNRAIAGVP
jgi:HPt (histidine-containing phosphotransfer) domain-containing protein